MLEVHVTARIDMSYGNPQAAAKVRTTCSPGRRVHHPEHQQELGSVLDEPQYECQQSCRARSQTFEEDPHRTSQSE